MPSENRPTENAPKGEGLYHRLDVEPEASQKQIRRAYLRLAPGAHPDVHPDDPDASRRFRELTHADEVLGDPHKRAVYDRARRPSRHTDATNAPASTPRS